MTWRVAAVVFFVLFVLRYEADPQATTVPSNSDSDSQVNEPVYKPGHGIKPPVLLKSVPPDDPYHEPCIEPFCKGVVKLEVVVDNTGHVRRVAVVRHLGKQRDEAAINAVEKWVFKPATKDGQPVNVQINVELNFGPR